MAPFQVPLAASQPESNLTLPWIQPGQQQQRMMHKAHYWGYAYSHGTTACARTHRGTAERRRDATDPGAHAAAPTGRVSRPSGRIIHPLEISHRTCGVKARRAAQVTKQRRLSRGRGDTAALCRAAVQSIVQRSYSPAYCGASLDSACTAEGKTKQGINKQRARPVPAGTRESEAAAKKVPPPPFCRTQYAVIASQAGISYLC